MTKFNVEEYIQNTNKLRKDLKNYSENTDFDNLSDKDIMVANSVKELLDDLIEFESKLNDVTENYDV